jgi:hypothetical protein
VSHTAHSQNWLQSEQHQGLRVAMGFAVRGCSRCEVRAKLVLGAGVVLGRRLQMPDGRAGANGRPRAHIPTGTAVPSPHSSARSKPARSLLEACLMPHTASQNPCSCSRAPFVIRDDAQRPSVHVQRTLPPAIACHSRSPSAARPRLCAPSWLCTTETACEAGSEPGQ